MNNSTSAIVTGSSGFIGSNLVAYLLRNNIKTLGIDPFEPEIENDLFENHIGYVDTLPDEMVNKFLIEIQPYFILEQKTQIWTYKYWRNN